MTPQLNGQVETACARALGAFQAFNPSALEQAVASAIMRNEAVLEPRFNAATPQEENAALTA